MSGPKCTLPVATAALLLLCLAGAGSALHVPVAALHFGPKERDVENNTLRLVAMCRAAAHAGAIVSVTTEMALSGYSFWSRAEMAPIAQPLDNSSALELFKAVAGETHTDILVGMPIVNRSTGLYYNSAVLVLRTGALGGHYAKMNHLLETSYNAESFPLPQAMSTSFGFRVATVICADSMKSLVARAAALSGADVLLIPINTWTETDLYQVIALENDIPVVVANRYGSTLNATQFSESIDQETLVLRSTQYGPSISFAGAKSFIVGRNGTVLATSQSDADAVVSATLDFEVGVHSLPAVRRPELYALIAQGTTTYADGSAIDYSGLPPCANFTAMAFRPPAQQQCGQLSDEVDSALNDSIIATPGGEPLRLVVLPAGIYPSTCTQNESDRALEEVGRLAVELGVDIAVTIGDTTELRTNSGTSFAYTRTHRRPTENASSVALGDRLVAVNRPYARVALLHDVDFMVPEVLQVLSKMAVDVVAVAADDTSSLLSLSPSVRALDASVHVVVANNRGTQGVYRGSWKLMPLKSEHPTAASLSLQTCFVRGKSSM
eukprot:m51a1_g12474 hypothetical protein (552) ;mRNA; r:1032-3110